MNQQIQRRTLKDQRSEGWLGEDDIHRIHEMLKQSPQERLQRIQNHVNSAIVLRNALRGRNDKKIDFIGTLGVLIRHGVDFIVVDGVAAVLAGAPILSSELEILYLATHRNEESLRNAAREIGGSLNDTTGHRYGIITPTDLGCIRARSRIGDGSSYHDLINNTVQHYVEDFLVRSLDLETQIIIRRKALRELDEYYLLFLYQISELMGSTPFTGDDAGISNVA